MRLPAFLCLWPLFSLWTSAQRTPHTPQYSIYNYYVLEHDPSTAHSPVDVAEALNVELIQQVGQLRNHWLVRATKPANANHDPVLSRHQDIKARAASSQHLGTRSVEALRERELAYSIRSFVPQIPRRRVKRDAYFSARAPPPIRPTKDKGTNPVIQALAQRLGIGDPIFPEQWHFVNSEYPEHMMNVTPVWEELGITGKGVYVAMVDDGVEYEHNDLKDNFFAEGSYDFNDHQALPTPKLSDDHHGTRCAGEISAVKNDVCGIGIAYKSKIAGLRILSGPISDVDEALALNYAYQNTSIYSCSWGPPDDGRSMEAPSTLIQRAVIEGIQNGRHGKGSIFVFASGNGAASGDQCNFDGYTNSIFSVTVGAVDYKGLHPYYSEACAANMIVTYSSGSGKSIHTTDFHGKCTSSHGGTSAAAPIASAVFALALEARPDLTWRDIQHLCVRTGVMINPDDPDWEKTATGRLYSYKYGYGRLDAWQYVTAAKTWNLVKPLAWVPMAISEVGGGEVDSKGKMLGGLDIVPGGVESTLTVSPDMLVEHNFETLEQITVKVWINHTRRGDVEVELISPNNIRSVLAGRRQHDSSGDGFPGWIFMTIKHWDENPVGNWTLRVHDQTVEGRSGRFLGWTMVLFGSSINASAAVPYTLSDVSASPGNPLPPGSTTAGEGGLKAHPKPTAHLPGDHGAAPGEASKPSFGQSSADASATPISTTLDEGYFQGMSHLLSNTTWLIGAIGAVLLFCIGAALYLWRRRRLGMKRHYASVDTGEDLPMMNRDGRGLASRTRDGGRTKELYDAFGEVSEDEADEETGLRRPLDSGGLEFHAGFLEDDETQSTTASIPYKDQPDEPTQATAHDSSQRRSGSPGSGDDGSWEHASQQARAE